MFHWKRWLVAVVIWTAGLARAGEPPAPAPEPPKPATTKDPYKDLYADYIPPFVALIRSHKGQYGAAFGGWNRTDEEMKLSTEPQFFTLNIVEEADRANALVEAGLKKEQEGQFREALKLYQMVIEKFPDTLYRVSGYGIFVPISQYCQRRILNFPQADLDFYRTLYDAKAKESFEQARRKNSLSGLAEIADTMLATRYGDNALLELGNAALDAGNFLEAMEYFTTLRDFLTDSECRTPELDLKINYCEKLLGDKVQPSSGANRMQGTLSAEDQARLKNLLDTASYEKPKFLSQQASAPNLSCDDYTLWPPTTDPMALLEPTWTQPLPGSRRDYFVYSQPVVTGNSLIYRHKNILYCHSLLTGELRWTNDTGGRVIWQNWHECQYPEEDILVQDGMVISPLYKVGPSLAAFDEVTGQLRWAYGPVAASNEEEAHMRFESAPAGGNRTVYAGYVLDNIEGETHTDSEYGVMAFESSTGRVRWRTPVCRLAPGKFSAGFAVARRNRIRSFTSPPLYHQGTVYYNTNAGSMVALDGRSGRIKWLMRYPYAPGIHDSTRPFGQIGPVHGGVETLRPHGLWLNQRPLMIGENLYMAPVDSSFLFSLNRRNGRISWNKPKMGPGFTYFLGAISTGELVVASNGRDQNKGYWGGGIGPPVFLLNPANGETVWTAPDLIMPENQPVMKHYVYGYNGAWFGMNHRWFENAARPFLTSDDQLYITNWCDASIYWRPGTHTYHLAGLSLKDRKITGQRRYYSGETLSHAAYCIDVASQEYKALDDLPAKDNNQKGIMAVLKEVIGDKVPENAHGPFMPFSRMTFNRYGAPFELRFSPRAVSMVYDRQAVRQVVEKREDPEAYFARAELAVAESRYDEAASLLNKCLATVSTEDLDFRALINQQLFQIHQRLARRGIFRAKPVEELESCLGMTRTASTLAEEIETLFALAEGYEHKGDLISAARCLRNIVGTYGHHEYPVSALAAAENVPVMTAANSTMAHAQAIASAPYYSREMNQSLNLLKNGFPLYFSTVSPLPKTLTVRAGELAASKLVRLQKKQDEFAKSFEATAAKELEGRTAEEQLYRLQEFPGTASAQKALDRLLQAVGADETGRKQLWALLDAARIGALTLPESVRAKYAAPASPKAPNGLSQPYQERTVECADAEGTARLILERRDDGQRHANLLFMGGRTRKRSDNKFVLTCFDLDSGKQRWEKADLRFLGNREKYLGEEGGFFEAFVYEDLVIVHGLYDVFAFGVADGELRWRYKVPFNFEIKHALQSGDLLVLAGLSETLALYIPASSQAGEVAWQEKETGDVYIAPYFHGDRLVSVRKLPFNVTVRFRATGKLMGRLALPDLSLNEAHPLVEGGPEELPAAHDGALLVVTDSWYYIALDITKMAVIWKRLIDQNDATREPAMRFFLKGDYLVVLKENYDQKAIYMLSSQTGEILWGTDPDPKKAATSPAPLYSIIIDGEKLYAIQPHAGQAFYLVGLEAKTGKVLFNKQEVKGYQAKPKVRLLPGVFGGQVVAEVQDNQDFELRAFDVKDGKELQKISKKGVGPFGVHGRVSANFQSGRLILLSKDKLSL